MRESQRPRRRDWQDTNRAINRSFGFFIPIALLTAAGYATWVVVIIACCLHSNPVQKLTGLLTSFSKLPLEIHRISSETTGSCHRDTRRLLHSSSPLAALLPPHHPIHLHEPWLHAPK